MLNLEEVYSISHFNPPCSSPTPPGASGRCSSGKAEGFIGRCGGGRLIGMFLIVMVNEQEFLNRMGQLWSGAEANGLPKANTTLNSSAKMIFSSFDLHSQRLACIVWRILLIIL
jgi:hypothetical protein